MVSRMIFLKTEHNELINLNHVLRIYKDLGGTYATFTVNVKLIDESIISNLFIGNLEDCDNYILSISNQLRLRDMVI